MQFNYSFIFTHRQAETNAKQWIHAIKANAFPILPICLGIEGIYLRIYFSAQVSPDYINYLDHWLDHIREFGFLNAFQYSFSDYSPLYLHLLAIFSLVIKSNLLTVKVISWIFEIIGLIYFIKILSFFNLPVRKRWNYAAIFFLLPTLLLNGSYWGQCDIVYSSMIIASVYYLIKDKYLPAYLFLGLAFSLKLQAMFVFPLYFLIFLFNKKTWKYFIVVPVVFLLSILPSYFAGRDFINLVLIYFNQAKPSDPLALNTASVYALYPSAENFHTLLGYLGIWFTGIITLTFCITIYFRKKTSGFLKQDIISFSLLFALTVPYFLPHMHERYFFLADLFSLLYVAIYGKNYFVPVVIIFTSLHYYLNYLVSFKLISPIHLSLLLLLMILLIATACFQKKSDRIANT